MTVTTNFPTIALAAGETALPIGTVKHGTLTQVSGAAAGFDVFTPTANCTYLLSIRVQDVATGAATNACHDLVTLAAIGGGWAPTVINHTVNLGACATTWARNVSALNLAVATGTTWYADVVVLARFPA